MLSIGGRATVALCAVALAGCASPAPGPTSAPPAVSASPWRDASSFPVAALAECVGQEVLGDGSGSTISQATAYAPPSATIDQVVVGQMESPGNSYVVVVRGDIRSPYSGTVSTGTGEQSLPSSVPAMWLVIPESTLTPRVGGAVCATDEVESGFLDSVPDLSSFGPGVPLSLAAIPTPPTS